MGVEHVGGFGDTCTMQACGRGVHVHVGEDLKENPCHGNPFVLHILSPVGYMD